MPPRSDHVLIVVAGAAAGTAIPVRDELVFGRASGGVLQLAEDPDLSRRHARVWRSNGSLLVEDLGSTNGTFVNGSRLDGRRELQAGDVLELGCSRLEVRVAETAPSHASPVSIGETALRLPIEQVGSPSSLHELPQLERAPDAVVLHEGERRPIPADGLSIGRLDDSDVVLAGDERVSRRHARIVPSEGRYYVADLGSLNGTHLNGEALVEESRWLNSGDTLRVGHTVLRFLIGAEDDGEASDLPLIRAIRLSKPRLAFGRDPANDVVLDSPSISRFHAEAVVEDGRVELRDLGSRNGTRVDGEIVQRAELRVGSEVGIGPYRLVFDGERFVERDDRGALRLEARAVDVTVKAKTILNNAYLSVLPGELVALIGESGSGKTTFLKVIAGVSGPSSGVVTVNGDAVASRVSELGYVPQAEIVHGRLTVGESLRYAARLRLPDASRADIEAAVQRVLADVSLQGHVDTRIELLSGGQRKRVGVATELLSRPGLLFLDEPTTGLDPGLETQLMELFRELAEVGRRAVVVVTHATKNLALADKLCVMGRGGEVCFIGPPEEAKAFFGVDDYDGIYRVLAATEPLEWRRRFERRHEQRASREPAPAASAPARPLGRRGPQARILAERYLKVFLRDRRNVAILLAQVPLLALATAFLFDGDVFRLGGEHANAASQLLFVLVTTTIWLGTLDAAREIIKERPVVERERAIGVRIGAYLASKGAVLCALAAIQVTVLATIVFLLRPAHEAAYRYVELLLVLWLTAFAAVAMGLLISALVNTEDQATAMIPLAMIVQLLFGGAIVTVKNMGAAVGVLSSVIFERWSFSGVGSVLRMNPRIAADRGFGPRNPYGDSFFDLPLPLTCAILLAFVVALLGGCSLLLRRRRP